MPEAVLSPDSPTTPEPSTSASGGSTWAKIRPVVTHPVFVGTVLLGIVYLFGSGLRQYEQFIVSLVLLNAIIGVGLVLLVGVGGQLSLGHATFLAVGAYTAANISTRSDIGLPLELLVAIVLAVVVGMIVGLPSLRLSGLLLAVGTLALGFAGQQILFIWTPVTGGGGGIVVRPLQIFGTPITLIGASVIVLGISLFLVFNLLRGRTGRALHALRTSDAAARSVGIEVERRRVAAFAMSAALTAAGGVLYGHAVSYLAPDNFGIDLSITLVIMTIIGGQRRLLGAVLGAAFVIGLPEQFRSFADYEGILYGVILLLVIIFAPGGIVEIVDRLIALVRRSFGGGRRRERAEPGTPRPVSIEDHSVAYRPEDHPEDPRTVADVAEALTELDAPVDAEVEAGGVLRTSRGHEVVVSAPGLRLAANDVRVDFGGVTAVRDVTFEVAPGEVLGLIGPNGAGKTTLFNAICGVVNSTGTVTFGDDDLSRMSVRKRAMTGVGRTFQNLSLHDGLTPIDHVLIGRHRFFRYGLTAEMLRLPKVVRSERDGYEEALALLELLGLADVAHDKVDDLPYGIQKRVDVARALASRPRILLLDEPAAGLPHDEADALIDHVLELTRPQGTSVIIIEHNVELVRRVSERIVVLNAGEILAVGGPEEILNSRLVAEAYLGV
jgi:ABC-type branched-subunit amino acid transport system ATPase component/ABC-type branched-subunit amino acid transport system permease subunit